MQWLSLWLPVVAYMAFIYWLSSQPVLPGVSLLPEWLSFDWLHHGLAYAVLAVLALRALTGADVRRVGGRTVAAAWLLAVVYGISDEWHQSFVPGRMADIRDVIANASGAALAVGTAWAWGIIKREP